MYNLLIVDDDEITREGISRFVIKNFPDINAVWTAPDGEEGLALFEEHHPDFIFTDIKMPRMDGLEFIEHLRQDGYQPRVIILSDYENFSYAQSAVRLGVEDYLTKPIMPAQILDVTRKLISKQDEHDRFLKNVRELMGKYHENLPVLRERFFNSLINTLPYESFDEQRVRLRAQRVDIDLSASFYTVAVLRVSSERFSSENELPAEQFTAFFATSSANIFPANLRVYDIVLGKTDIALIILSNSPDQNELFKIVNISLNKLLIYARKYVNIVVDGALGRQYNQIEGIRRSFSDALEVLESLENCPEDGLIRNYGDITPYKNFLKGVVLTKPEVALLHGVKYQPYDRCVEYADQLFVMLKSFWPFHSDYVKSYFLKLAVLIWRDLQNANNDESDFKVDFSALLATDEMTTCIQWFRLFLRMVIENYEHMNEEKGDTLLNKARRIMLDNLSNSEFNIDDVASQLYISSSYLRQIFKKQSSESFVEYLTHIRMEKALELLQNSNLKIQDVAEQAGFSNQRYFAVCFKKYYGKTPTEYRN
jgi:two-component system response regulator YesN